MDCLCTQTGLTTSVSSRIDGLVASGRQRLSRWQERDGWIGLPFKCRAKSAFLSAGQYCGGVTSGWSATSTADEREIMYTCKCVCVCYEIKLIWCHLPYL